MIPHDHNDIDNDDDDNIDDANDDIDANDDGDNCHRVQNCAILIYEFIST